MFDLEPGHTAAHPQLRRLKSPAAEDPVYDRTLRHDTILDIVAQLIGPTIRTNGNKLNMKSAGFGSEVEWHQDWAFYPHTNDDILAVGVALDDMMLENGCLLGWLIDPTRRCVEVYRPGRKVDKRDELETIAADPELPGFVLDLSRIWEVDF